MSQAASENAPNKPVHLIFLMGTVALFFMLQWSVDWIWGYFAPVPGDLAVSVGSGIVAIIVGLALYNNDRVYDLANQVASELKKVTWPSAKDVRTSTLTVLLMAVVASLILFLFDVAWSSLTELVYG